MAILKRDLGKPIERELLKFLQSREVAGWIRFVTLVEAGVLLKLQVVLLLDELGVAASWPVAANKSCDVEFLLLHNFDLSLMQLEGQPDIFLVV